MIHEKILRRPDGSRVKIRVELNTHWNDIGYDLIYSVRECEPHSKAFRDVAFRGNATAEEIIDVMRELIAKIEPAV